MIAPLRPTGLSFAINRAKVTGYLLKLEHPDGGSKAKFFIGHGFGLSDLDVFVAALLAHAVLPATRLVPSPYGTKYVFERPMPTPNGSVPMIRTVWLESRSERGIAYLVTAVPM